MKKLFSVIIMAVGMIFTLSAERSLAVATFDISGNAVTKDEAEAITELYITELVATGKVNVVDRMNFDKILKEMNFQNSDWSNAEKTAELGKIINANLIARGQIIKLGSKMYLSSSIIDIKTANVLSSSRKEFTNLDEIFSILTPFTEELVSGLSPKIGSIGPGGGMVYSVEGNIAYEVSPILGDFTWYSGNNACMNYRGGELSDWYLPSKYELEKVWQETNLIHGTYWTSTKSGSLWGNDHYDTFQVYSNGAQIWPWEDTSNCTVRAIRKWNYMEE